MVSYNHYLKEIGVNEMDYPFSKNDERYEPDEEGFVSAEFFDLDYTLALYIYSQLCYFRDHCVYVTPWGLTEKEWKDILNRMITAFKLIITADNDFANDNTLDPEKRRLASKRRQRKIARGMKDFVKYFHSLSY